MMRIISVVLMSAVAVSASSCGSIEENIDYYGNDIGQSYQDNPEDCCDDCENHSGCVAYSWFNGVCYLKNKQAEGTWAPGVHSGSIRLANRQCGVLESNVDYPGNDIARTDTDTAEQCCEKCASNKACIVSVWYKGACYLKDNDSYKTRVRGAKAFRITNSNKPTVKPSTQPTPAPKPTTPSKNGDLATQVTYQLSVIRQAHGLNEVQYDHQMAAEMQAWADDCSQHPHGGHGGPYGVQNLAPALTCGDNCMTQDGPSWWWYDEIKNWDFSANDCRPDADASGCGHFQNSLGTWVTHVGCGWSTCYNPSIGRDDPLIWCNYRGNGNDYAIPPPEKSMEEILHEFLSPYKN